MLSRQTPLAWRRGFSLYRRSLETDSMGDPVAVYHMDEPDFTAEDGTEDGICWQSVQSWQSGGRLTSGLSRKEPGESSTGAVEGCLFTDLELSPGDRLTIGEGLYEVRSLQQWPGHRKVLAQRIG
ncbi:MAG: hypothetical protein LUC39_06455 [Clostridiales bacterium]|nr:hypothetical protein [Clostridiales bacterium]